LRRGATKAADSAGRTMVGVAAEGAVVDFRWDCVVAGGGFVDVSGGGG